MDHEQHVGESGAKVDTINVVVSRGFWSVDIHTFGAVDFHH